MARVFALLALGLCLARPVPAAMAESTDGAADFIRQVGREIPVVIGDARTVQAKRVRLLPFISRVVDVPAVAQYCLGRYWSRATAAQQQEYQRLFLSVIVNTVATWVGNYDGSAGQSKVVMAAPALVGDETYVPTLVQTGNEPPAQITWIVNMQSRPPKIRDVVAGGISLRVMQRSDYVAYLGHHDGDIAGLIAVLRQRAAQTGGTL
jgi:phospholipid transport system substrate-binding protein